MTSFVFGLGEVAAFQKWTIGGTSSSECASFRRFRCFGPKKGEIGEEGGFFKRLYTAVWEMPTDFAIALTGNMLQTLLTPHKKMS
jgi:hypothetical protein